MKIISITGFAHIGSGADRKLLSDILRLVISWRGIESRKLRSADSSRIISNQFKDLSMKTSSTESLNLIDFAQALCAPLSSRTKRTNNGVNNHNESIYYIVGWLHRTAYGPFCHALLLETQFSKHSQWLNKLHENFFSQEKWKIELTARCWCLFGSCVKW